MQSIDMLINLSLDSGVYSFEKPSSLRKLDSLLAKGVEVFYLDGNKIGSKQDFLNQISREMKFPSYFGNNWDALLDCLRDMEWYSASGYILVFDNFGDFAEHNEDILSIVIGIMEDAALFWKERMQNSPPMYILLQDTDLKGLNIKKLTE